MDPQLKEGLGGIMVEFGRGRRKRAAGSEVLGSHKFVFVGNVAWNEKHKCEERQRKEAGGPVGQRVGECC